MEQVYMYELLGKYLSGEIGEKDKKAIEEWVGASDHNAKEFEMHKRAWENTSIHFQSPEAETVFKNVLNKIDDQQELELAKKHRFIHSKPKNRFAFITKIAASLLIIGTLSYYFYSGLPDIDKTETSVALIQKKNIAGQKSKIYLPDGSQVWLNAESEISFPEQFEIGKREVTLEGEAFFDVVKNPDQPFIVHAGNVSTTVLGTSFSIKAFPEESMAYVALNTGKVKVNIDNGKDGEALYLNPGEAIRYDKKHQKSMKEAIDRDTFFSWKDGVIVFEDAHMEEVIGTLCRWYGVQFQIENTAKEDWSYTGSFDNEALENVLRSMSFTKDFSYEINQKNVQIKFN